MPRFIDPVAAAVVFRESPAHLKAEASKRIQDQAVRAVASLPAVQGFSGFAEMVKVKHEVKKEIYDGVFKKESSPRANFEPASCGLSAPSSRAADGLRLKREKLDEAFEENSDSDIEMDDTDIQQEIKVEIVDDAPIVFGDYINNLGRVNTEARTARWAAEEVSEYEDMMDESQDGEEIDRSEPTPVVIKQEVEDDVVMADEPVRQEPVHYDSSDSENDESKETPELAEYYSALHRQVNIFNYGTDLNGFVVARAATPSVETEQKVEEDAPVAVRAVTPQILQEEPERVPASPPAQRSSSSPLLPLLSSAERARIARAHLNFPRPGPARDPRRIPAECAAYADARMNRPRHFSPRRPAHAPDYDFEYRYLPREFRQQHTARFGLHDEAVSLTLAAERLVRQNERANEARIILLLPRLRTARVTDQDLQRTAWRNFKMKADKLMSEYRVSNDVIGQLASFIYD